MIEIMQSIRPEWIQKIIDGEKTVEVRKTRPESKPPYRVYVYCTKPRWPYEDALMVGYSLAQPVSVFGGGKVVGEYICNDIFPLWTDYAREGTCLTDEQLKDYLGDNGRGWGWSITQFTHYGIPKNLSAFERYKDRGTWTLLLPLERAPQSWCYVEKVKK